MWKSLHMLVYVAYALVVLHVALGVLQAERHPLLATLLGLGLAAIVTLHVTAGQRERRLDRAARAGAVSARAAASADAPAPNATRSASVPDGFVEVCRIDDIREQRARIVTLAGERVAVFRYEVRVYPKRVKYGGPMGMSRRRSSHEKTTIALSPPAPLAPESAGRRLGDVLDRVNDVDEITERKRAERGARRHSELLMGQQEVLELMAWGGRASSILDTLLRLIEAHCPGTLASIVLLEPDGERLRHLAAPSLPASFARAVDGESIGPQAGSCGTAVFRPDVLRRATEASAAGAGVTDSLLARRREEPRFRSWWWPPWATRRWSFVSCGWAPATTSRSTATTSSGCRRF